MGKPTNARTLRLGMPEHVWESSSVPKNIEENSLITFKSNKLKNIIIRLLAVYGMTLHTYRVIHSYPYLVVLVSFMLHEKVKPESLPDNNVIFKKKGHKKKKRWWHYKKKKKKKKNRFRNVKSS